MAVLDSCPLCNGEIIEKEVEKLLRGGNNTGIITVRAQVCLLCGERFYSKDTISIFEEIRKKLESSETAEFKKLGESFRVAS